MGLVRIEASANTRLSPSTASAGDPLVFVSIRFA